jgi:WD40 repeat protein
MLALSTLFILCLTPTFCAGFNPFNDHPIIKTATAHTYSKENYYLITGHDDGQVFIWKTKELNEYSEPVLIKLNDKEQNASSIIPKQKTAITILQFVPDNSMLAIGCANGHVRLCDIIHHYYPHKQVSIARLFTNNHKSAVTAFAFNYHGGCFAVGFEDGLVKIYRKTLLARNYYHIVDPCKLSSPIISLTLSAPSNTLTVITEDYTRVVIRRKEKQE